MQRHYWVLVFCIFFLSGPCLAGPNPFGEEGEVVVPVESSPAQKMDDTLSATPDSSQPAANGSATPGSETESSVKASLGSEVALKKQLDLALQRSAQRGLNVFSGADNINHADLNNWIVHYGDMNNGTSFLTGQEKSLIDKIKEIVAKSNQKLTAGEVIEIALKLNGGDLSKSLLTIHNAFRQLSRGRESIAGLGEDHAFFHDFLDSRSVGLDNPKPGKDISDVWYHCFGMAALSYVGNNKNPYQATKDLLSQNKNNAKTANISSFVAVLKSWGNSSAWLPGGIGVGTSTAVNDALGEQAYYGFLATAGEWAAKNRNGNFLHDCGINLVSWGHGFSGLEQDEFSGEMRGIGIGTYLGALVK
jgi:hypothetical protein